MLARVVGVLGRVLVAAGLFVLGFVAFQLWGTGLQESREQSALADSLTQAVPAAASATGGSASDVAAALAAVDPATAPPLAPPPEGEPLGIIEIPAIELSRVVVSGVSKADLRKGPGHYPGTPLPGQAGNSGIAGHRTTYGAPFNRIDELVPGDEIVVTTQQGRFVYEVVPATGSDQAWFVVDPSDVSVLDPTGDNRITLTACHPEYSARQRIIVQGVLRGSTAAAAAAPSGPVGAPVEDGAAEDAVSESPGEEGEVAAGELDGGLGGDPDALVPTLLWGAAAALVLVGASVLAARWRRWPTYLVATPLVLVSVWSCWTYLDQWLPAI